MLPSPGTRDLNIRALQEVNASRGHEEKRSPGQP